MPMKGFIQVVGKLQIHAMRIVDSLEVPAGKSDAQCYHVFRRSDGGSMEFVGKDSDLDFVETFCLQRASLHLSLIHI